MVKILAFDLDGTLLNSLADIQYALNTSLGEHGFAQHDSDSVRRLVGHGLSELIKKAVPPDLNRPDITDPVLQRMRQIYKEIPFRYTEPYPGIPELLEQLKTDGYLMTVLTNKADPIAQIIIEHFFKGVFDLVQGETPDFPRKPHPDALHRLLRRIAPQTGIAATDSPALCQAAVLIGDSEADIQTAHAAGVRSIGVSWGFRSPAELRAAGADLVVDTTDALAIALAQLKFKE